MAKRKKQARQVLREAKRAHRQQVKEQQRARFYEERANQDELDRETAMQDERARIEEIADNFFDSLIAQIRSTHDRAGSWFSEMLSSQINQYGKRAVYESMSGADIEKIASAVAVLFYAPESHAGQEAFVYLMEVITGTVPTAEDLFTMSEYITADEYVN